MWEELTKAEKERAERAIAESRKRVDERAKIEGARRRLLWNTHHLRERTEQ